MPSVGDQSGAGPVLLLRALCQGRGAEVCGSVFCWGGGRGAFKGSPVQGRAERGCVLSWGGQSSSWVAMVHSMLMAFVGAACN